MIHMNKVLILLLAILIVNSCTTKQEHTDNDKKTSQDTTPSLQVTIIADLQDSLQPKTIFLDTVPKPLTIEVPQKERGSYSITNTKGEVRTINLEPPVRKTLPVLQNEKGETILDPKGEPFIMGDGGKSHFTNFISDNGLALDAVKCSIMDAKGNLWFGTYGGGVSRYDGTLFTTFTTAHGLAGNSVYSITEDKAGNLWFGTNGGRVSRYDGISFTTFTKAQGLSGNLVNCITEDKAGNLWLGTDGGGVSLYDGISFTTFTTAQGLVSNVVLSITEDKAGNLWFGTGGGGVSRYDGTSFTTFTTVQGLVNNSVVSIIEDKAGNLWFGTDGGGVSRYDGISFANFTIAQGLAHNVVFNITEDKAGNLWFGTYGGGVSLYDGTSFTNFTKAQGLASNFVVNITEDKAGNLWFGTDGGLSLLSAESIKKLEGKSFKIKGKEFAKKSIFKSFTTNDGLPDNFVTNVIPLPDGRMAIGTNLGIAFFKLSDDLTQLKNIEVYNSHTGYPVKDVNVGQHCMFLDSKGIIWAGTGNDKNALVRFDYKALRKNIGPPSLVLQSIKVKDENICWYNLQSKGIRKNHVDSASALLQEYLAYGKSLSASENDSILQRFGSIQFDGITRYYPIPENLVLPYEHNQIAFEFAAIETGNTFLLKYQYMLEGYDKDWRPVTNKSNASFGNMYEGTYTFTLRAQGANGVWSKPIMYTFEVLPPLYRTWWAYLIYVLLFLSTLRIFTKWQERKLTEENEKLEKTVAERTEEVVKEKNEADKHREEADKHREEADKQRQRSDELLLNILPKEVAEELKLRGSFEPKYFDHVTIMFTDFKNFTQITSKMTPKELVEEIHTCFKAFDIIIEKYGMEKIKTIGDSYMCAGGLPVGNTTHAIDVVGASLEIRQFILNRVAEQTAAGKQPFEMRIGINTGPVVAGVVGSKKFAYDIWGDTVNTASRIEANGEVGKVNISAATYEWIKDTFKCVHRGKIQVKGKEDIDMYFVEERM